MAAEARNCKLWNKMDVRSDSPTFGCQDVWTASVTTGCLQLYCQHECFPRGGRRPEPEATTHRHLLPRSRARGVRDNCTPPYDISTGTVVGLYFILGARPAQTVQPRKSGSIPNSDNRHASPKRPRPALAPPGFQLDSYRQLLPWK